MNLGDNIPTWNIVCGIAIAGIIGCIVFDRVAPRPKLGTALAKLNKDEQAARLTKAEAMKTYTVAEKAIADGSWAVSATDVGPAILDKVNRAATEKSVKVTTFRPQRIQSAPPLKVAEYTVSVQGSYLQVIAFIRGLEDPASKLAVSSAQISSTDAATSLVSASVGIVAFANEPTKSAEKSKGGK